MIISQILIQESNDIGLNVFQLYLLLERKDQIKNIEKEMSV